MTARRTSLGHWLTLFLGMGVSAAGFAAQVAFPGGGAGGNPLVPPPVAPAPALNLQTADPDIVQQSHFFSLGPSLRRLLTYDAPGAENAAGAGRRPVGVGLLPSQGRLSLQTTWGEASWHDVNPAGDDLGGVLRESYLWLDLPLTARLDAGVGLSESRLRLRGRGGWEIGATGADARLALRIVDGLRVGVFSLNRMVDVEDLNENGAENILGLNVTHLSRFDRVDLALTAALAKTFEDVAYQQQDTLFSSRADLRINWTQWFASSLYASFTDSLRCGTPYDRTFWVTGFDLILIPHDQVALTVGWEKVLAVKDYGQYLVRAALEFHW